MAGDIPETGGSDAGGQEGGSGVGGGGDVGAGEQGGDVGAVGQVGARNEAADLNAAFMGAPSSVKVESNQYETQNANGTQSRTVLTRDYAYDPSAIKQESTRMAAEKSANELLELEDRYGSAAVDAASRTERTDLSSLSVQLEVNHAAKNIEQSNARSSGEGQRLANQADMGQGTDAANRAERFDLPNSRTGQGAGPSVEQPKAPAERQDNTLQANRNAPEGSSQGQQSQHQENPSQQDKHLTSEQQEWQRFQQKVREAQKHQLQHPEKTQPQQGKPLRDAFFNALRGDAAQRGEQQQAADMATRVERSNLPKSSPEGPEAHSDHRRQSDNIPINQRTQGPNADAASRAERTELPKASLAQIDTADTFDGNPREKSQTSEQDHQVAPQHEHTLSSKEREERLRTVTPEDGIGFRFGSAQLVPGAMEDWYENLQESQRAALSDPNAHVLVIASASRPGSDSYNRQLSFERGNMVLQWLQDHGLRAYIDIYAVGEDLAKQAGKPDGVDDASDRVAKIEIVPRITPKEGVEKLLGQAPQPTKENKTLKAGRELFDITKDTGKDALKSPEPPYEILKGIGKAVKWAGEHTLQDISEAKIEFEISANFIPAFRGEIERLTEGSQHHFPFQDNMFAQQGRETARQIWDDLPKSTQDGLKILAHSDQGDAFRKQLGEAMQNQYISKDIKYLNQDLHFNNP